MTTHDLDAVIAAALNQKRFDEEVRHYPIEAEYLQEVRRDLERELNTDRVPGAVRASDPETQIRALLYVGDCIRHLADRLPQLSSSVLRPPQTIIYHGNARCPWCRTRNITECTHGPDTAHRRGEDTADG